MQKDSVALLLGASRITFKTINQMIQRITIILLVALFAACGVKKTVSPPVPPAKEETITAEVTAQEKDAVKEAFNNYKSAILNDKGEEAVNHVDSRTIAYYSDILEKTKTADSTSVESLELMDKLMVFAIRHRTSKEKILSFDGKELLVHAIQEGMVGKNSVANNSIGEVTIDGDFAKGQFIANGQAAPFFFHFYQESGDWKVDLTSIFPPANMAFQQMVDQSGQSENEYLFMLLGMLTGKEPGAEIWETIK